MQTNDLLYFFYFGSLAACLLVPWIKSMRRWVPLILIALASWMLAFLQIEVTFQLAIDAEKIIDGDGPKSLFVWYLGWLPAVILTLVSFVAQWLVKYFREKNYFQPSSEAISHKKRVAITLKRTPSDYALQRVCDLFKIQKLESLNLSFSSIFEPENCNQDSVDDMLFDLHWMNARLGTEYETITIREWCSLVELYSAECPVFYDETVLDWRIDRVNLWKKARKLRGGFFTCSLSYKLLKLPPRKNGKSEPISIL